MPSSLHIVQHNTDMAQEEYNEKRRRFLHSPSPTQRMERAID